MGIYRWMIEHVRVDILTEVSMLSSHMALPRQRHLEAALDVMSYLLLHHKLRLCMDPTYPTINSTQFPICNWSKFYSKVEESIPTIAPYALGKVLELCQFVDSDHDGDQCTHISRSGFLMYLNSASITWYSKRQYTIETCTFGTEFVVVGTGIEDLWGICYKLCLMGIPIGEATNIYGGSMSVINITSKPESVLKKKNNAVCYHTVCAPHYTYRWWWESCWNVDKGHQQWKKDVSSKYHSAWCEQPSKQVFLDPILEPTILEGLD